MCARARSMCGGFRGFSNSKVVFASKSVGVDRDGMLHDERGCPSTIHFLQTRWLATLTPSCIKYSGTLSIKISLTAADAKITLQRPTRRLPSGRQRWEGG